jgi:predicted transglutaminase-like protease
MPPLKISIDIIKKAIRKRKDNKVKGSTIFKAFLENKKLKPKIEDVSIPDKIGRAFGLCFIEIPPT